MDARPTFGLLVDWLEDEYQNKVLAGAEDAAKKLGLNLVVFAGGVLASAQSGGLHRNFIFDLAGPHNLDGLVIMSGAIGNMVGPDELARFCVRFRPLPMCSIGIELPGMPCVLVDNQRGMRNLVVHLIQVHGCRRLAFIRGPRVNAEAQGRYRVYREVLSEYGIPLDPELITEGDFQSPSGMAAIRNMLDERRVQFDAVVAADDTMALGAMEALMARGIRVPYDVAVAGFDDIEAARFATSPLTTVRQPLQELGAYAVQMALAQSRGESVEDRVFLRTQLAVRQSCGCPQHVALPAAQYERSLSVETLERTFSARRRRIIQDMAQAMRSLSGSLESGWGERLLDALGSELRRDPEGVFAATFDEILTTAAVMGANVGAWQAAVSVLRHHAQACAKSDPEGHGRAEELWHQARIAVGEVAERAQAQQRLQSERWWQVLRSTEEALSTALDTGAVSEVLSAQLPQLKIPSCHVALFEGQNRPAEHARLAAVYRAAGLPPEIAAGTVFPSRDLAPPGFLDQVRRSTYAVQPLFVETEQLGFAVLELGPHQGMMSEQLREQLNAALKSSLLLQEVVDVASRRPLPGQERGGQDSAVAARIRGAVQPRQLDAPGLRISAATIGARDPGGDLYDLHPIPGGEGCWLVLGTVAGHGLDTALASVMLQSAVAAACAHGPRSAPSDLLRAVNAVLFENVRRRLGQELPTALTLIRCDAQGRMAFAGGHRDLLLCRARDGRCIRLPTSMEASVDEHYQVEEADLLVAFTEGVVEARNEHGVAFGVERLAAEVERLRLDPVEHIRDRLLDTIGGFMTSQDEDLTVVVARYGLSEETIALDEHTRP